MVEVDYDELYKVRKAATKAPKPFTEDFGGVYAAKTAVRATAASPAMPTRSGVPATTLQGSTADDYVRKDAAVLAVRAEAEQQLAASRAEIAAVRQQHEEAEKKLEDSWAAAARLSQLAMEAASVRKQLTAAQTATAVAQRRAAAAEAAAEAAAAALAKLQERKVCRTGRPLSDAALACKRRHAPGKKARRTRNRNARKAQEALCAEAAQEKRHAAELMAVAQEAAANAGVSTLDRAKAAVAAMPDDDAKTRDVKKRHGRYVAAHETSLSRLAQVGEWDPRRLQQRLSGVASDAVSSLKKVSRDYHQRARQDRRQKKARIDTAKQNAEWQQRHMPPARPQNRGGKLDRQHKIQKRSTPYGRRQQMDKRQDRREKKTKRRGER
eukprot:SAG11_NODE_4694_length_1803_cov_1.485915_1_plen_382_part_00